MTPQYSNSLKKQLCEEVCLHNKSTMKTAQNFGIPLKTLEKWITAYNKDKYHFDEPDSDDFRIISNIQQNDSYDDMTNEELKKQLMKLEIENTRLKKGYAVKGCGSEKKVFVTFSKKNTK